MGSASMDSNLVMKFFEALEEAKSRPVSFTVTCSNLNQGISTARILVLDDLLYRELEKQSPFPFLDITGA